MGISSCRRWGILIVARQKLSPTCSFIEFLAFVSFFPQLVAGPIERATNLLPQFLAKRKINPERVALGLRQIVWGLFKKIVVADNCARYANEVFNNYENYNSLTLGLGAIAFAFHERSNAKRSSATASLACLERLLRYQRNLDVLSIPYTFRPCVIC